MRKNGPFNDLRQTKVFSDSVRYRWGVRLLPLLVLVTADIKAIELQRELRWTPSTDASGSLLLKESAVGEPTAAVSLTGRSAMRSEQAVEVHRHQQHHRGLVVFGSRESVLVDREGRVRGIMSSRASAPAPEVWSASLQAVEAIGLAVDELVGTEGVLISPRLQERRDGGDLYAIHSQDRRFLTAAPARVEEVWFPVAGALLPAYRIELIGRSEGRWQPLAGLLVISAQNGEVLHARDLIHDLRPSTRPQGCVGGNCVQPAFSYRAMADRRGTPYVDPYGHTSPHPTALPDGHVPRQQAPMHRIALAHAGLSTGDPWLPPGATETVGNNVDSFFRGIEVIDGHYTSNPFADWVNELNPATGDFRAKVTAPGVFDYAYDVELAPDDYAQRPGRPAQPIPTGSQQLNAKIVQGFYAANWLHDLFYDLGFDEAAGNMQHDNFGRGGLAGDRMIVHSGHALGSAFAFAPVDGISPVLSLGLNGFSMSNRDVAGFDYGVFVHEWTHTMFARLTDMVYQGQPGAVNEGTADFVAMFLMVRAGDRFAAPGTGDFHGAYAVGAYWNLDYFWPFDDLPPAGSPGRPDNTYYHGIRRFPYSASLAINPLTFGHLSPDKPLPAGFQPYDWKGRGPVRHEIHTAGEIWTSALWQCARNILAETPNRRFHERHRQFLADLVAALQLFPTDATYTEARDAMLITVRARDEQDYLRCRAGFALRGLGADAVSPPRDAIEFHGVVESFVDADPPALR